jgi:hypothetical protein
MRSARDTDLLRAMAISSYTKQQKNTTVELAESSMAIRRRNNFRFEPTSEVLPVWARCRIQDGSRRDLHPHHRPWSTPGDCQEASRRLSIRKTVAFPTSVAKK